MKRIFQSIVLIASLGGLAIGQTRELSQCSNIKMKALASIPKTTVSSHIFSSGCWLEFADSKDIETDVTITNYDSEVESMRAIKASVVGAELIGGFDNSLELPIELRDGKMFWDSIYFQSPSKSSSGIIYVRKGKIVVHILSQDRASLFQFEQIVKSDPIYLKTVF